MLLCTHTLSFRAYIPALILLNVCVSLEDIRCVRAAVQDGSRWAGLQDPSNNLSLDRFDQSPTRTCDFLWVVHNDEFRLKNIPCKLFFSANHHHSCHWWGFSFSLMILWQIPPKQLPPSPVYQVSVPPGSDQPSLINPDSHGSVWRMCLCCWTQCFSYLITGVPIILSTPFRPVRTGQSTRSFLQIVIDVFREM